MKANFRNSNLITLLKRTLFIFILFCLSSTSLHAQDTQWRGPDRDGKFTDTLLLKQWPEQGPKMLFTTAGLGMSNASTIATKDFIYTTGNIDTLEVLSCLNLKGEIVWQKPYGQCWQKSYPEARCTPTLEGNRIYVLSAQDNLVCFDATTGSEIWAVDIHAVYGSEWDIFGVSESVLIHGDMIITTPAGKQTTVIALDKMMGKLIWKSESMNTMRSNMAPVMIHHAGRDYFISATKTHVISVDVSNGEIVWTHHYNILHKGDNSTILANTPIYKDSCLWISNGWDVASVMLEIAPDGKSVSVKYNDHTFDSQNHGAILYDGFVYGSNFTGRQSGKWICMHWNTGEIVWIEEFHTKGPILFADGMLYIMDEKRGNIGLVKANEKEFELISSFKVTEGKGPFWSRPAIYNKMLLVRHGDVLVAYDIKQD